MNAPSPDAREAADAAWPSGPLIRPAALDVLLQAWPGKRLRRSTARRRRSLVAELETHGWTDASGRFTEQSRELLASVAKPMSSWMARGRHQGLTSDLHVYCSAENATLSIGPDAATLRAASGDHAPVRGAELPVAIRAVDNSEVPALLCAWAGVRTGARATEYRIEVPVPVFTARAHGSAGSAPREFEKALELWNDDWFVWDVTTQSASQYGFVSTAACGNFAFGQTLADGVPTIRMVSVESSEILQILESQSTS